MSKWWEWKYRFGTGRMYRTPDGLILAVHPSTNLHPGCFGVWSCIVDESGRIVSPFYGHRLGYASIRDHYKHFGPCGSPGEVQGNLDRLAAELGWDEVDFDWLADRFDENHDQVMRAQGLTPESHPDCFMDRSRVRR